MPVAQVQYHGLYGNTKSCVDAIIRLIQFGDQINKGLLLTFDSQHSFLLTINESERVVINAGFSSGYSGEGPKGLRRVLQLLQLHCTEVEELDVSKKIFSNIVQCKLTEEQLYEIENLPFIRPMRLGSDYIHDIGQLTDSEVLASFPPVICWGILDERLLDLALKLDAGEHNALMTAFTRLEDVLRDRCKIIGSGGTKLVTSAFRGENAKLVWPDIAQSEVDGRCNLFTGAFMTFRNNRAHKEISYDRANEIREFMILNQLFLLEKESTENDGNE